MPTEQPALRIRRATPLDAVNLYKLLVDEEQNTGIDIEFDEAARLAHILHVIATGYVAVAEKSGRLVGTIGFSAGGPQYAKARILTSEWYFLIPSLQNSQVPASFVNRIVSFADRHGVGISFSGPEHEPALSAALELHGFGNARVTLTREPANNEPAEEQDATGSEPEGADGEDSAPTEPV